jgi:hypothetical protein
MHFVTTPVLSFLVHLLVITIFATYGFGQIYHVKEMNTEQIRALDPEKTVVLIPGGILEQHGPYLPSFSDGYMAERRTEELANAIVERPGWKVLVFPPYSVGHRPSQYRRAKVRLPWLLHCAARDAAGDFYGLGHRLRRAGLSLDLYCAFAPQHKP